MLVPRSQALIVVTGMPVLCHAVCKRTFVERFFREPNSKCLWFHPEFFGHDADNQRGVYPPRKKGPYLHIGDHTALHSSHYLLSQQSMCLSPGADICIERQRPVGALF